MILSIIVFPNLAILGSKFFKPFPVGSGTASTAALHTDSSSPVTVASIAPDSASALVPILRKAADRPTTRTSGLPAPAATSLLISLNISLKSLMTVFTVEEMVMITGLHFRPDCTKVRIGLTCTRAIIL